MDPSDQNQIEVTVTKHVDRISTLPDDVITNSILSLLPTRDSVRTSALSTRWKHLYASVPVIKFTDNPKNVNQRDPTVFAGIVSNVLNTVTNKLPRISHFHVSVNEIRVSSSDVISWIETATSHSVQTLVVYGFWVEFAPLPHCLFTCETLVSLSVDLSFLFRVPDKVCLPKLKNLWLKNLIFSDESDDESVKRLFSSCLVLEKLMVFSSSTPPNARVFSVSIPSLKKLGLYLEHPGIELSINCPNLEKLSCDCYATRGYSGDVLGSLKECEIEVELYEDDQQFEQGKLIELVRQVCKVQFLSLAGDSMRSLLVPTSSLPIFENLTRLELTSDTLMGWRLLPSLLDSSPSLETLDFAKGFLDIDNYFGNPYSPPEHVPACLSFNLKVIKIGRFIGEEEEYNWVEYFLRNALFLEKMEIRLWSSEDFEEENDPAVEGGGEGEVEVEGEGVGDVEGEGNGEIEGEGEGEGAGNGEVEGEGNGEIEVEVEVEVEGEGEGEGAGNGEVEGEGAGNGEEEDQDVGGSEFERHFEISKRLLSYQRSSEVCQIVLLPPDY